MKRICLTALTVAVLCLVCGCAGVGRYLGNRSADLADVLTLELTVGPIADVHVQATSFLGTGFGSSKQWGLMWHGRYVGLGGRDSDGLILTASTHTSGDLLFPLYGEEPYDDRDLTWVIFLRWPPIVPPSEWPRLLNVEAGASLIVGVHAGVSPIELVDFVFGLTTLDICGDDAPAEPPPPQEPPPEPAAATPIT